jgi:dTDP-4-amino-4,6-dideoxygalactose transaminase
MSGRQRLLVSEPVLGEDDEAALVRVIRSNWITMGEQVRAFERDFAALHGADDAVAVNSCTSGLHLALDALGIGKGDEVIVPSLSFVATANTVVYTGAQPVLVDIESAEVPLISTAAAEAMCSSRTRAVIVMHYAGAVVDAQAWRDLARRHGLYLIEDSAHAVGRSRGPIFGDIAVFSFYGNKNMTTAEGGMIVASDSGLLERMRRARAHGMTSTTAERLYARAATYDVRSLGYNYRMSELNAALGVVQLPKLDDWNERRRSLVQAYHSALQSRHDDLLLPLAGHAPSSHHILPILLPGGTDRARIMGLLHERGVQTTIHYPPIHRLTWYRERYPGVCLPIAEEFARRELTLPLHPKLTTRQVDMVSSALLEILALEPCLENR